MRSTFILTLIFVFVSCGRTRHNSSINSNEPSGVEKNDTSKNRIEQQKITKKEFDIKKIIDTKGEEKYYDPNSPFNYFIGTENVVHFVSGDNPIVMIPGWDLLIFEDSVQFKKAKINNETKPQYKINQKLDIFRVKVEETGQACDDTKAHKVIIENSDHLSTINKLAKVVIFKNCIGNKQELYVVSYHQCLLPDLKIYRVRQ